MSFDISIPILWFLLGCAAAGYVAGRGLKPRTKLRVFGCTLAIDVSAVESVAIVDTPSGSYDRHDFHKVGVIYLKNRSPLYVPAEAARSLLKYFSAAPASATGASAGALDCSNTVTK